MSKITILSTYRAKKNGLVYPNRHAKLWAHIAKGYVVPERPSDIKKGG